jgi:hypothetical protein
LAIGKGELEEPEDGSEKKRYSNDPSKTEQKR